MSNDVIFQNRLQQKLQEIFLLEPTNLGSRRLTIIYKMITGRLKHMPFLYIIPLSIVSATLLYVIFGGVIIKLVSLLQHGF